MNAADEIKQLKKREIGAHARRLREDALLVQIFEGLRKRYADEWATSDLLDGALREKKYMQLRALLDFWEQFSALIADGKAASLFLDHEAKLKAVA